MDAKVSEAAEPKRKSDVTFLERKFRGLVARRNASDTSVETIGDLGLNLLHEPSECLVDFIFVHGLRGGSRKSWSASPSQAHYWPKEWLPADSDFRHVRIHSFGYNSDWLNFRENLLNIHDFGQSLIEEIQNSPSIRRTKNTRIVFIGHSMGGLVVKKACILSRENPSFNELGDRIHSIYFLATPHRGSDLAQTLGKILKTIPSGDKPFIGSLERGSETINALNEQFRHVCKEWLFIHLQNPSQPTGDLGQVWSLINSYPDERIQALNTDHRNICKFESPDDSNFRTLRNRLASTVDDIERSLPNSRHQAYREEMQSLSRYLSVSRSSIDNLSSLEDARIPGSCEWLTCKKAFLNWQFVEDSPRYFWLTGRPATGKSVITAHVIGCLDENNCNYYFFKHGDQDRSSLSGLLLSLAHQMAQKSHSIRDKLLELSQDDSCLDKNDYRSIWRRLFVGGIFCVDFPSTQYWVIDALDECLGAEKRGFDNFFAILAKIDHSIPLKVFISSRPSVELERLFATLSFVNIQTSIEDSTEDIRMFVKTYADDLPAEDEETREHLVETVVRKSAGCFLWTVLVMRQLQDIYTLEEIEEVLHEVPEEMDALYTRNLQIMESRTRTKKLAHTVLIWTICATRSLTLEELKNAIWLDLKTIVARDLEKSISTLCSQFVFVDKHTRVHIVHDTARTFLLNQNLESEFKVQLPLGNVQLGLVCLGYLTSDEMSFPRRRRSSANILREPSKNALASYACLSFSEHLVQSTSSSDPLFLALMKFLRTNVLVWIERMAEDSDLNGLIRTAKHLKAYQARRAKHAPLLQDDISSWATDLPRIVTEFGTNLSKHPAAIHNFIPPLCPRSSGIYRQFGASQAAIRLFGLASSDWNDRISCWRYDKTARSIACKDQWFAIGLSDGTVDIHWVPTCQKAVNMNHGEPVRILRFGNLSKILVSTGLRFVKMWDVSTGSKLWEHGIKSDPLAVEFDDDDKRLVVATRSKEIITWSTINGSLLLHDNWHQKLPHKSHGIISRAPSAISFSASHKLMAVVYRSMPLYLWDLDAQEQLGFCTKDFDDGRDTSNNIISVCFNPVQVLNLLAVAYMDGDVALFDTVSRTMTCHSRVNTQLLAASPDGRTLAGGDSDGNIKLFDFETLQLLYRVNVSTDGVTTLAFTDDSLRLLDARGTQVNVWEPSALVRKWNYADDDRSEFSSEASAPLSQGSVMSPIEQTGDITDMRIAYAGSLVICGRNNGSIDMCDISSTEPAFQGLYKHRGAFMLIISLDWNESQQIVASADISGRFKVMRLLKATNNTITVRDELLDAQLSFGQSVSQLLISPDGTRILVSSSTADYIWSLQTGKLVASREAVLRTNWRWFTHPQQLTHILLLDNFTVNYFLWEASEHFSIAAEIPIDTGERQILDLESTILNIKSNTLVTKLSTTPKSPGIYLPLRCAEKMSLYTLDLTTPGSQQPLLLKPLFELQDIKNLPYAKILLGTVPGAFGSCLLVFLAENGWICTIDLDKPAPHTTFQRHFFLPSTWLSTSKKIISAVTERKDILLVCGHEVAIIKRGLETGEVISIF